MIGQSIVFIYKKDNIFLLSILGFVKYYINGSASMDHANEFDIFGSSLEECLLKIVFDSNFSYNSMTDR